MLLKVDPSAAPGFIPKVADFGLSVLLPGEATHVSNLRQGTPFYTAPEVALQVGCAAQLPPPASKETLATRQGGPHRQYDLYLPRCASAY